VLGVAGGEIIESRWVDNGPGWVGVMLSDAEAVLALRPDFSRREGLEQLDIGVVGMQPPESECTYEVRAFFSDHHGGMVEDPVTGSLNASIAQWMLETGRVEAPYVASQGTTIGRSGRIHISGDSDGTVWVGGHVFDVVSGELTGIQT
jgi:PhzF family phenazine biosynthesis protein